MLLSAHISVAVDVVAAVVHIGLLLARLMLCCCSVICCGWGTVSYLLSLSLKSWITHLKFLLSKYIKIPKLDELHVFPVHLLSQHPVGIFKAQHSQSKLIFPHPPGVTRLFGGKIIFSVIFFLVSHVLFFFGLAPTSGAPSTCRPSWPRAPERPGRHHGDPHDEPDPCPWWPCRGRLPSSPGQSSCSLGHSRDTSQSHHLHC